MEKCSIARLLECPICYTAYSSDPKVLQCQHSCCIDCLYKIYMEQQQATKMPNRGQVNCPICKKVTVLPIFPAKKQKVPLSREKLQNLVPNNLTLISMMEHCKLETAKQKELQKPTSIASKSMKGDQEHSKKVETGSNQCTKCATVPSWICLSCNKKLCNSCFPGHIELSGDHETYNLDEEVKKFSTIKENRKEMQKQGKKLDQFTPGTKAWLSTFPGAAASGYVKENVRNTVEKAKPPTPKRIPPPVPPRYPQTNISNMISPGKDASGNTPRKILVDAQNNIFVCFEEAKCGIHKYSTDGSFTKKGLIEKLTNLAPFVQDMCLDSRNSHLYVLSVGKVWSEKNQSYLEMFSSQDGKMRKLLKDFGSDSFLFVAANSKTPDQLFLVDQHNSVAIFSVSFQLIKEIYLQNHPTVSSALAHRHVIAMDCQETGQLTLLMKHDKLRDTIIVTCSPCKQSEYVYYHIVPTKPGSLTEPVSLCVTNSRIFVADQGARRIAIFNSSGAEAEFEENLGISEVKKFSWKPKSVACGVDGRLYILDGASNSVLTTKGMQDKQMKNIHGLKNAK